MTSITRPDVPSNMIRSRYLGYAAAALVMMVVAIKSNDFWFLNFVHVFSSLLWTGIDLFLGFVLGPMLRRQELAIRRAIARQLTPRTLLLMPTIAIVSGTTGWFLAVQLGYTALPWPEFGWVAAAVVLVVLMTIQGLGVLTPVNVVVCLELQKDEPDLEKVGRLMQRYFYAVALQGTMQVAMIVVMTRFRLGL